MQVTIFPHDPTWANQFLSYKAELESILVSTTYTSIIHVGSTSIPGLPAKPVLDIDIIVSLANLAAVRAALVGAGYTDCGEMNVPGRFAFRQPGFGVKDAAFGHVVGEKEGEMRRNTYAMIEGCTALRNHLDIKRVLMEDQELREEYGELKRSLMGKEYQSIGEYAFAKNEILWKILRGAGWGEEDLAPVVAANS